MAVGDHTRMAKALRALQMNEDGKAVEIRYKLTRTDEKKIYNLFRSVCQLTNRDPRRVLISLLDEWSLEEAGKVGLHMPSIMEDM